jgi:hypothetical protein
MNDIFEAAGSDVKVNMSDAKALALDASLKQMGFSVEQRPGAPIIMPWWAPFAITFGGTFGIPLSLVVVPVAVKWLKEQLAKRAEKDERRVVARAAQPFPGTPMTPAVETLQSPVEGPREGEIVTEEGPRRVMPEVGPQGPAKMPYRKPSKAER